MHANTSNSAIASYHSSSAMATCSKRKRKVLSIEQKLEICRRLRSGASVTALSKEMDVGKSSICDIKRNEEKLTSFIAKMDSTEGSLKRKNDETD